VIPSSWEKRSAFYRNAICWASTVHLPPAEIIHHSLAIWRRFFLTLGVSLHTKLMLVTLTAACVQDSFLSWELSLPGAKLAYVWHAGIKTERRKVGGRIPAIANGHFPRIPCYDRSPAKIMRLSRLCSQQARGTGRPLQPERDLGGALMEWGLPSRG